MTHEPSVDFETSSQKVTALLEPRNVVIVGASDRAGSIGLMVRRNLVRYGFPGQVYLVNPGREEVDGERCYRDLAALPEGPDHLAVLVPAPNVCRLLEEAHRAGARSATIFSTGFGEALDRDGALLARELGAVIARTGLAVSGPNCMGNLAVKSGLMTLGLRDPVAFTRGPVALAGQSGGILLYLYWALAEHGIAAEYMVTSGNESGLKLSDYIGYFADQPSLRIIVIYLEAIGDVERFRAACRHARTAGKWIIAVKLGRSEAGREAALAHTAAVAGSIDAFEAVAREAGVICVETLDDVVETVELLAHSGPPAGRRLGALTLSGAFRGFLLDAAEQYRLTFPPLAPQTVDMLRSVLGAGTLLSNPIDGGYSVITSQDTFLTCIDALNSDPGIDMILVQEALPSRPGSDRAEAYMAALEAYIVERGRKPISYVTLVSHGLTDYSLKLRAGTPHISFLHETTKSLRAIDNMVAMRDQERLASLPPEHTAVSAKARDVVARVTARVQGAAITLGQTEARELLTAFGVPWLTGSGNADVGRATLGFRDDPDVGAVLFAGESGGNAGAPRGVACCSLPASRAKLDAMVERSGFGNTWRETHNSRIAREAIVGALIGLGGVAEALGDALESIDVMFSVVPAHGNSAALDAAVVLRPPRRV